MLQAFLTNHKVLAIGGSYCHRKVVAIVIGSLSSLGSAFVGNWEGHNYISAMYMKGIHSSG